MKQKTMKTKSRTQPFNDTTKNLLCQNITPFYYDTVRDEVSMENFL